MRRHGRNHGRKPFIFSMMVYTRKSVKPRVENSGCHHIKVSDEIKHSWVPRFRCILDQVALPVADLINGFGDQEEWSLPVVTRRGQLAETLCNYAKRVFFLSSEAQFQRLPWCKGEPYMKVFFQVFECEFTQSHKKVASADNQWSCRTRQPTRQVQQPRDYLACWTSLPNHR